MVPADFMTYYSTSATAAAALVGLLFVAVSIAPESSLARSAPPQRRAMAVGAFTGLLNAFFISLCALIPHVDFAGPLLGIAISSLISTLISLWLLLKRLERDAPVVRLLFIPLVSFAIFGLEISLCALPLMQTPTSATPFVWLAFLLFGVYGLALARAWQLMAGVPAALAARAQAAQGKQNLSSGASSADKSLPEAAPATIQAAEGLET